MPPQRHGKEGRRVPSKRGGGGALCIGAHALAEQHAGRLLNDIPLEKVLLVCYNRFTEKLLYGYVDIEEFIQDTEEKLKAANQEEFITTIGDINYDSIQVSPTFNIGRITERKALDRIEEEKQWQGGYNTFFEKVKVWFISKL